MSDRDVDAPAQPGLDQPDPPPDPVVGLVNTFDLDADPEALQAAAGAMRALGLRATAAGQTVTVAADTVESEGAWRGDTASNYQHHRRKITDDLASLGYETIYAADVLDEVVALLLFYQAALRNERSAISGIPTTVADGTDADGVSGMFVTYHPRTEAEATAVFDALARAADLRSSLAGDLALKEASFRRVVDGYVGPASYASSPGLRLLGEAWQPRTLRQLNLNIGEGDPTDAGDMGEIAAIINRHDANVVTIQEVFREDLDEIEEHLDGDWEIYFANADNKARGASPENWHEDFGNAVLVRRGDGISSRAIEDDNRVVLDPEGDTYPAAPGAPDNYSNIDPDDMVTETVSDEEIPDDEFRPDGEARVAAVAEITIER